jgi:hypothetical protein
MDHPQSHKAGTRSTNLLAEQKELLVLDFEIGSAKLKRTDLGILRNVLLEPI